MATSFDPWRAADQVLAEARQRAGNGITCHSGCDDCCRKPFAITAADADRLREGLSLLPVADRAGITARAGRLWQRMRLAFPGNDAGILHANSEWREWFFRRWHGPACPVLDETAGVCRLYEYRPVACRLYGPLIQIGAVQADPCPKCFPDWEKSRIAATLVLAHFPDEPPAAETIIAAALSAVGMSPAPPDSLHPR